MSTLQVLSCDGCGATASETSYGQLCPPFDWLEIEGTATVAEADETGEYRVYAPKRHACSPACLLVVAQRLADLDNALQPVNQSS